MESFLIPISVGDVHLQWGGTEVLNRIVEHVGWIRPHFGIQLREHRTLLDFTLILRAGLHFKRTDATLNVQRVNRLITGVIDEWFEVHLGDGVLRD